MSGMITYARAQRCPHEEQQASTVMPSSPLRSCLSTWDTFFDVHFPQVVIPSTTPFSGGVQSMFCRATSSLESGSDRVILKYSILDRGHECEPLGRMKGVHSDVCSWVIGVKAAPH